MKKDWTVWRWTGKAWRKMRTYHADGYYSPKEHAEDYANEHDGVIRAFVRVLPAGREPKGRPR